MSPALGASVVRRPLVGWQGRWQRGTTQGVVTARTRDEAARVVFANTGVWLGVGTAPERVVAS